jgi:hypothetical protein
VIEVRGEGEDVGAVREIMGVERVVDVACVCMVHVVCSGKGKREKNGEILPSWCHFFWYTASSILPLAYQKSGTPAVCGGTAYNLVDPYPWRTTCWYDNGK